MLCRDEPCGMRGDGVSLADGVRSDLPIAARREIPPQGSEEVRGDLRIRVQLCNDAVRIVGNRCDEDRDPVHAHLSAQ